MPTHSVAQSVTGAGQVSGPTFDLQSRPYRPDVFRSERRLRTDQLSFVPGRALRR